MGMHADVFSVFFSNFSVLVSDTSNLLRIEGTIAVYNVDTISGALSHHFKSLIYISLLGI